MARLSVAFLNLLANAPENQSDLLMALGFYGVITINITDEVDAS
jgi:hypothetical protein